MAIKWVAARKFKYNGQELNRGDEWIPINGKWDRQIRENLVQAVEVEWPTDIPAVLRDAYTSTADIRAASDEELLAYDGIGPATLRKVREALA